MIGIDTTFFGHEEAREKRLSLSTSIFTADLLDAFCELGLEKNFCLFVNYNHAEFFSKRFPKYKQIILSQPVLKAANAILKKPLTRFLKKWGVFKNAAEKNCDALWFPYAVPQTYVRTKLPAFVTIHDIAQFHNGRPASQYELLFCKKNKVVCVSNYTKKDLQNSLGLSDEIFVIPNSIKFDASKTKRPPQIQNEFILDINAYTPKKNALVLLESFSKIAGRIPHDLVLCGGYKDENYFQKIASFIKEKNLQNRVKIFFGISDEERNWLLKNAAIFVTPSLFEGFGRTPVEAAICGVPVISSKEASLFEATMGLCNYVEDAKNPADYAEKILQTLSGPQSKERLLQIAKTLKAEYDAKTCAKRYAKIFALL